MGYGNLPFPLQVKNERPQFPDSNPGNIGAQPASAQEMVKIGYTASNNGY